MLVIITGPSGVGKTSVIRTLLQRYPDMKYSVSMTTRKPRPKEVDGVDYHFVTHEEFKKRLENDEFVEWSEVYGQYYGRLKKDLDDQLNSEEVVLVGIDVQGALKLQRVYPDGVFIFLLPKSGEALESQLRGRGTDTEEDIRVRLESAKKEIQMSDNFDYKVVNNEIFDTAEKVRCIIMAEKCRVKKFTR